MSDTERPRERWMRPGDRPILRFLAAEGPEYPAIVANRTGMHAPRVEERCEALAERGLAEAVSGESVYRVTDAGLKHV
jgi:DNA-binding Lrp family transcriptional regulator